MLKVSNLHVNYGGINALRGIDINIEENQIVTLIGANGAGKSSTLRAIMGLVEKSQGKVEYDGEDVTNLRTKDIVKKGMVMV
ncbi:MAG: ATP-binding cassette domain-containing protein, partial [Tissierellia bacterium]|nr:ATP-binding cassette domain-containing protein [Tissierellia bacterium]